MPLTQRQKRRNRAKKVWADLVGPDAGNSGKRKIFPGEPVLPSALARYTTPCDWEQEKEKFKEREARREAKRAAARHSQEAEQQSEQRPDNGSIEAA
jgi:hypothetical protein